MYFYINIYWIIRFSPSDYVFNIKKKVCAFNQLEKKIIF